MSASASPVLPSAFVSEEPLIDPALDDDDQGAGPSTGAVTLNAAIDGSSTGTQGAPDSQDTRSSGEDYLVFLQDHGHIPSSGPSTFSDPSTLADVVPTVTKATTDADGNLVVPVPPIGPHRSRRDAEDAIRVYALANNFDINITHSDVHRHVVTLACVRGGKYRCTRGPGHDQVRQRGKRTGKTGCMWRVTFRDENYRVDEESDMSETPFDSKESWVYTPSLDLYNDHNHPPILPGDNPKARHKTITPQVKEVIFKEMRKGTPTRQVWEKVQNDFPECLANMTDVKNIIGRKKREMPSL